MESSPAIMALCLRVLRLNVRPSSHRMMSAAPTENVFADEENALTEEQIEEKRDISRMARRMYVRKVKQEYLAEKAYDFSVKSLRKDYVVYGSQTGINPGVCWPNKEDFADKVENERRWFKTFDELKQELDEKRVTERKRMVERDASIEENLSKLAQWRAEMLVKEEKVKQQEAAKKAKLDELIREVREHIGYNLDPSDPKFQEVMEMKETERKKAEREARRAAKKEKMMQRLMTVPKVVDPSAPKVSEAETKPADSAQPKPAAEADSSSTKGDSK